MAPNEFAPLSNEMKLMSTRYHLILWGGIVNGSCVLGNVTNSCYFGPLSCGVSLQALPRCLKRHREVAIGRSKESKLGEVI